MIASIDLSRSLTGRNRNQMRPKSLERRVAGQNVRGAGDCGGLLPCRRHRPVLGIEEGTNRPRTAARRSVTSSSSVHPPARDLRASGHVRMMSSEVQLTVKQWGRVSPAGMWTAWPKSSSVCTLTTQCLPMGNFGISSVPACRGRPARGRSGARTTGTGPPTRSTPGVDPIAADAGPFGRAVAARGAPVDAAVPGLPRGDDDRGSGSTRPPPFPERQAVPD